MNFYKYNTVRPRPRWLQEEYMTSPYITLPQSKMKTKLSVESVLNLSTKIYTKQIKNKQQKNHK